MIDSSDRRRTLGPCGHSSLELIRGAEPGMFADEVPAGASATATRFECTIANTIKAEGPLFKAEECFLWNARWMSLKPLPSAQQA